MKNRLIQIFLITGIALSFQACLFQEEDVFDKSPAERLEEVLTNAKTTLKSSRYGWKLAYDSNETTCYHFFMKFSGKDSVSVLSDIKTSYMTKPAISTYSLVQSQGPVVSFDTYNEQLSYLAAPNSTGATKGGDNDFIIMKVTSDSIVLKGLKSQRSIVMHRANETDEAGYFVNDVNFNNLFSKSNNSPFFCNLLFSDGLSIGFRTEINKRYIAFLHKNEQDKLITNRLSYDFNGHGFNVWRPITINGKTFSDFIWNESEQNFYPSIDPGAKFVFSHTTPFPYGNTVEKNKGRKLVLSSYSTMVKKNIIDPIMITYSSNERQYKGLEVIWSPETGKGYFSVLIAATGSYDPNNFFFMSGTTTLREDQAVFLDDDSRSGFSVNRLNNNPYIERLKAFIFGNAGFTVYEDGRDVYLISISDSSNWLQFSIVD